MLFLEIKYHLFRNRARSLLLVCVSAALCGCIAFFAHNVQANRQALEQLEESSPATLTLTNILMNTFDQLNVRGEDADRLVELGLGKLNAASSVMGYWKADYEQDLYDVEALAVTNLETIDFSSTEGIEYAPGVDGSFLEGDEPLCLVSRSFAEENGISLGDTLSMHLRRLLFSSQQTDAFQVISTEKFSLQVAGIFGGKSTTAYTDDLFLPSLWLRAQVEKAGMNFYYSSFSGSLKDSMELNRFKEGLAEYGYRQPIVMTPQSTAEAMVDKSAATTAVMEDKTFIRAAEKLGASLQYYRVLAVPLLFLAVGVITLAVFLVLRGARREMAIACSLGRPKGKTAAAHFLAVLTAEAAGCVLTVLPMLLLGVSLSTLLTAWAILLLCALPGNAVGLLILLRFEPMTLLVQSE